MIPVLFFLFGPSPYLLVLFSQECGNLSGRGIVLISGIPGIPLLSHPPPGTLYDNPVL